MKKVAILCRGESLKYLSSLPEIDEYIIVNAFSAELNQKFIIDRLSDNKPITHVIGLATLKSAYHATAHFDEMRKHYKNFNIQKIVLPYVKECIASEENLDFNVEGRNGIILPDITSHGIKDLGRAFASTIIKKNCIAYVHCCIETIITISSHI